MWNCSVTLPSRTVAKLVCGMQQVNAPQHVTCWSGYHLMSVCGAESKASESVAPHLATQLLSRHSWKRPPGDIKLCLRRYLQCKMCSQLGLCFSIVLVPEQTICLECQFASTSTAAAGRHPCGSSFIAVCFRSGYWCVGAVSLRHERLVCCKFPLLLSAVLSSEYCTTVVPPAP